MIPESGAQREAKVIQILEMASSDPQVAGLISSASNAREIVKALHIDDVITINEADSEDLALEDIDILLESEPLINPEWQQLTEQLQQATVEHEGAKQQATALAQSGGVDPSIVQGGQQMEQAVQQMEQQLQQTPQYLPSVPVPDDQSLDYATIAATVFSYMQGSEGRRLRRAAAQESPDNDPEHSANWKKFTNIMLYWKANKALAEKYTKGSPQPKLSVTGKLAPDQVTQLLMSAGINVNPQSQPEPQEQEIETIERGPYSEVKKTQRRKL
jgi:hypothetical protein